MRPLRLAAASAVLATVTLGCGSLDGPSGGAVVNAAPAARPTTITALGRLEPKDGILRVAGPSRPSVVIARLLVEKGDRVEAGQAIAVLGLTYGNAIVSDYAGGNTGGRPY